MGYLESWIEKNPGWEYRFWTDDDLLAFFREERPDLLDLYQSYTRPVQKADLARYCILQRFGGLYADVDTRCLQSLEPIVGDDRVILCEEPSRHREPALIRGLDRLWFNGTMASPPGRPFWNSVIDLCRLMADRRDGDVLETTGPLILTAAVNNWPDPGSLALNSSGLFADMDVHGNPSDDEPYGPFAAFTFSTHLWKGSWFKRRKASWPRRKMARIRMLRDWMFGGPRLDPAKALADIDMTLLHHGQPPRPENGQLLVLIPVRDAEPTLSRCFELLLALDYPRDRLHLRFGHGDSRDNSARMLADFVTRHAADFASVEVVECGRNAPRLNRRKRWKPEVQRVRRAGIAKARNDLLEKTLMPEHDWVLWIDADVVDYPAEIVSRLASSGARIVVPNCVRDPGGPSFDLNTFLTVYQPGRVEFYRHVRDGLLQPPEDWAPRRHLHDLRYLETVPLHGVGGTMILVDADCHRAGLRFPEKPYRHLIETEGFGALARDAGVIPIGMPQLEIIHARD
jgi:hypothetical protein